MPAGTRMTTLLYAKTACYGRPVETKQESQMWPDQRLCDLFEIEHPIVQAPMLGSCTPALAQAVSNAGGLGTLGCAEKAAEQIHHDIREVRLRTNRSFNVNFFIREARDAMQGLSPR